MHQSQISIDGIHLCGIAGRPQWHEELDVKMRLGNRPTNIEKNPYTLDARGALKPEITPAREPLEHSSLSVPPKWDKLINFIQLAAGRLWMQLLNDFIPKGLPNETFWKLLAIYKGDLKYIPLYCLWQQMPVPLIDDQKLKWVKISDLSMELQLIQDKDECYFKTHGNQNIKLPHNISEWEKNGKEHPSLQIQLNTIILAFSRLSISDNDMKFTISYPDNAENTVDSLAISNFMQYIQTLRYENDMKDFITGETLLPTANANHPLVILGLNNKDNDLLSKFASSFVPCIVDIVSSKKRERSFSKPDRWMKISAHHYFQIDWSIYENNSIKAPYKVYLNNQIMEITELDFIKWRDS